MGRHYRYKKRNGWKITGIVVASALVLAGITGGGIYWNLNHRIQENAVDIGTPPPKPKKTVAPKVIEETVTVDEFSGAFTVLLVGSDSDDGVREQSLNDVNIILHVSEDHSKARAISIPRDMLVTVPECTDPNTGQLNYPESGVKINTALSTGGLKCVVDTVRDLTGATIDYAAMIEFGGVVSLSNAVGGVPVCVSSDINDDYANLYLTAGEHSLSGEDALAFLRTRHGVGDGSDLARISNQQVFLSSLMRTLKSSETLSDPKKVFGIANAVADNMTLSTSLASIPTLASLAYSLKDIPLEDITFMQYPTKYVQVGDSTAVVPDEAAAITMIEAAFSNQQIDLSGGTGPGSTGAVETHPQPDPLVNDGAEGTAPEPVAPSPEEEQLSVEEAPAPVVLPSEVTGMNASQNTCSRGFGEY